MPAAFSIVSPCIVFPILYTLFGSSAFEMGLHGDAGAFGGKGAERTRPYLRESAGRNHPLQLFRPLPLLAFWRLYLKTGARLFPSDRRPTRKPVGFLQTCASEFPIAMVPLAIGFAEGSIRLLAGEEPSRSMPQHWQTVSWGDPGRA